MAGVNASDDAKLVESDDDVFYRTGERPERSSSKLQRVKTIDRYGFIRSPDAHPQHMQEIMPREVYVTRERKWLDMLGNWDFWIKRKFPKIKERCRKGIPHSIRARAWQYLSSSKRQSNMYQVYLSRSISSRQDTEIRIDVHRTFPNHHLFAEDAGMGQRQLYNVLKAYTAYNPREGFCQAHAFIASVLLMHMPEEEAFWCLVAMVDSYLPGYYSGQLEEIKRDAQILFNLLKRVHPKLHKRMKELHIDPLLFMVEWFMCLYSRDLPWPSVLRVWDIFFCEGVKILFRVALVLLKHCTNHLDKIPNDFYDLLGSLKTRNMPQHILQPDFLLEECFRLPIKERDMVREHKKLLKSRSNERPDDPAANGRINT